MLAVLLAYTVCLHVYKLSPLLMSHSMYNYQEYCNEIHATYLKCTVLHAVIRFYSSMDTSRQAHLSKHSSDCRLHGFDVCEIGQRECDHR